MAEGVVHLAAMSRRRANDDNWIMKDDIFAGRRMRAAGERARARACQRPVPSDRSGALPGR